MHEQFLEPWVHYSLFLRAKKVNLMTMLSAVLVSCRAVGIGEFAYLGGEVDSEYTQDCKEIGKAQKRSSCSSGAIWIGPDEMSQEHSFHFSLLLLLAFQF